VPTQLSCNAMQTTIVSALALLTLLIAGETAQAQISVFIAVGDVEPNIREGDTVNPGTTISTGVDGLVVLEESWPSSAVYEVDGNCVNWVIISGGAKQKIESRRGSRCSPKDDLNESIRRAIDMQREVSTVIAFVGAGGKADGTLSIAEIRAEFDPLKAATLGIPLEDGVYTIQQKSTGRYADAHEYDGRDWMLVTRDWQNNDTQRWIVRRVGPSLYTIQQKSTGRYVDAHEYDGKDWTLVTRDPQNNDTQRWIIRRVANGLYTIQQKSTGRYVDAHVTGSHDFAIVTRPPQNNDTQRWIFRRQ